MTGRDGAFDFHLAVAPAGVPQPFGAGHLEPDEVVGVVHHAHPIGLGIADADLRQSARRRDRR